MSALAPAGFPEANTVLGPPAGKKEAFGPDDKGGVGSLSVFLGDYDDGDSCCVSRWKIDEEGLAQIKQTGELWVTHMSRTMPPMIITTDKPEFSQ